MTEAFVDFAANYQLGRLVQQGDGFEVYEAVELSVDAPCHLHKIFLGDSITSQQRQAAEAVLRRYSQLVHPRAPRLADAWFAEDHLAVVDYPTDAKPFTLGAENPLAGSSSISAGDIFEGTLDLMAALHGCSIVHKRIAPEIFGLGSLRKIYLLNTSLDASLVKCFQSDDFDAGPILSTNLYSHDVGCWAFHILSLRLNEVLLDYGTDEKWDDYHFHQTKARLESSLPDVVGVEFFMDCLKGLGGDPPRFDNAGAAYQFWKQQGLRSRFS